MVAFSDIIYVVLSIDHMIVLDGWKLIVAENVQAIGCYYGDHKSDDQHDSFANHDHINKDQVIFQPIKVQHNYYSAVSNRDQYYYNKSLV